ncbi:MAG: ribonuclease H-like YkuK family protein [Acidobacteriota bacterium]
MFFHSPTRGKLTLEQVVDDILEYINEDHSYQYKLIVGSDSQSRESACCFVSAIILHRVGKGARYYYNRRYDRRITSLRQRIFYEASLSLDLADQLLQCMTIKGQEAMKVEIHLDVGTHGETKELVKDIIGMVVGSGFDACIKPYSCGASKVADRYTK